MKLLKIKLASALLLLPLLSSAQFYLGPGSTFYAPAGSILSFDSLTLIPSTGLALSNLTITKTYTPISGAGGNSVTRVYNMSSPITMSGVVGIHVANSELNGNTFPSLQIAYDAGAGFITTSTSVVNVAVGYVADTFSTAVALSRITATGTGIQLAVEEVARSGENPGLSIYPNPAVDIVYAELSGNPPPGGAWMTITDMSGKVLMRQPFDQQKINLDVSRLAAGIYFATYSDGKSIVNLRLSKL